jgi:hypothetical protein
MRKRRIPEQVNFGQLPAFKRKTFIYLEPQQDYPVVCLNLSRIDCRHPNVFVVFEPYIAMRGCRDRMVVGFTTTCVISVYHH